MVFARDTEANLHAAVELVNSDRRRDGDDVLATVEQRGAFYRRGGYSVRHDGDAAELAEVHEARARLGRLWDVGRDEAAELVNTIMRDAAAVPFLVRHDALDWHLHATVADAPLATVMLVETAMGVSDVIRSDEYDRLRRCAGEDCSAVLVDLSRNRSRRFCDVNNCGNRAHVAAYRARHSTP